MTIANDGHQEVRVFDEGVETCIFPDTSAYYVEVAAPVAANTWSDWGEIQDSNGTSFATITAQGPVQIHGVIIEDVSTAAKIFTGELAYGDDKIVVDRGRWLLAAANKTDSLTTFGVNSLVIPTGETLYGRVMCEQGSATSKVAFLYHFANR
jgi:hypothetical protein